MILFSLKFYGFRDQVLQLFPSWSALITHVLLLQDGKNEENSPITWKPTNIQVTFLTLKLSHLTFGPHEWCADIADLLIPRFDLGVTVDFDVWGVLYKNNIFNFSADGTSFTDLEAW